LAGEAAQFVQGGAFAGADDLAFVEEEDERGAAGDEAGEQVGEFAAALQRVGAGTVCLVQQDDAGVLVQAGRQRGGQSADETLGTVSDGAHELLGEGPGRREQPRVGPVLEAEVAQHAGGDGGLAGAGSAGDHHQVPGGVAFDGGDGVMDGLAGLVLLGDELEAVPAADGVGDPGQQPGTGAVL
jgi:hypothetical protein